MIEGNRESLFTDSGAVTVEVACVPTNVDGTVQPRFAGAVRSAPSPPWGEAFPFDAGGRPGRASDVHARLCMSSKAALRSQDVVPVRHT